jgi:hypothetical protein
MSILVRASVMSKACCDSVESGDALFACGAWCIRAATSPVFSGPRPRAYTEARKRSSHQRQGTAQTAARPRMGPAPTGAIAAPQVAVVTGRQTRTATALPLLLLGGTHALQCAAWVAGSGLRAQAPFAVAPMRAWQSGVDDFATAPQRPSPASVGRRTQARAGRPARCHARDFTAARPPPRTHDPPTSG